MTTPKSVLLVALTFAVALVALWPVAPAVASTEAPDNPDGIQVKLLSQAEAGGMVKDAIVRYHLAQGLLKCTGVQAYQGETGEELVFDIVGLNSDGCPRKSEATPVRDLIRINLRTGLMEKQAVGHGFEPVGL